MRDVCVDVTSAIPARSFLTYEPYYGLKEKPFSLSADPRFLYKSPTHAAIFDALRAGIRRREGIIVLTGEPGTGKTTLCRSVLESLDRKTFCTFVPDPFASREDLLKMLLIDFGVVSVEELKGGRLHAASRPELSYPLHDFLRSLLPLQAYAVLILDEAQNLTSQLLEEIRILSDLEGPEKLLQLVLVGQPELHDKLKDPTLRQVDQRISVRCSLETLQPDAVRHYIAHRLTIAGCGSDRVEFTCEALDLAYNASNGNPRVLNLIADKSLHRGHLDRTSTITPSIVAAALGDLGYTTPAPAPGVSLPVVYPVPVPTVTLALELFPPEQPVPHRPLPGLVDDGPHFLLEEGVALGRNVKDEPQDRRRRLRGVCLAVIAGLLLAASGLTLHEWQLRRQELTQRVALPVLPTPPAQSISAGATPVVPPPDFFAAVSP